MTDIIRLPYHFRKYIFGITSFLTAVSLVLFLASCASKPPPVTTLPTSSQEEGFAIYLTADDIPVSQMAALSHVELADAPLLSITDIESYQWDTHTVTLSPEGVRKINELAVPTDGLSFLVCVNRQPVYWGAFWSLWSSALARCVTITVTPPTEDPIIEIGHYSFSSPQIPDPRNDPRILNSLRSSHKLVEVLPGLPVSEHLLSRIDPSWNLSSSGVSGPSFSLFYSYIDTFSPDGRHVAYHAALEGGKCFAVLDDTHGKSYDSVSCFTFSPDSTCFVYVAQSGNEYFVVLDGEEGKHYPGKPHVNDIYFNPCSIGPPVFSPDSKHFAYVAEAGGKCEVVIDGNIIASYDLISYSNVRVLDPGIIFSEDSRKVAFIAGTIGNNGSPQWFTVIDGVKGREYEYVSGFVFSPDGTRNACIAEKDGKWFAVVDGIEMPHESVYQVVFSPDSQHFGYRAGWSLGNDCIVVDGVAGPLYDSVVGPFFSPDSQQVAYNAARGGKWRTIIDGREGETYDRIQGPVIFSPDSRRFACCAVVANSGFMVVDGGEINRDEPVNENDPRFVFSPDSLNYAYLDYNYNNVVVNGAAGSNYGMIFGPPVFSPDSKHVAYLAAYGQGMKVVVDGAETRSYDQVLILNTSKPAEGTPPTSLFFDSSSHLHFLAQSGSDILLVEVDIK